MFTNNEIEDIILGLADIIVECRHLRKENAELKKYQQMYYESVSDRAKDAGMHSFNMLQLALMMSEREGSKSEN